MAKQEFAADVDALLANYNSAESNLNRLSDALPETPEKPQILSTVESLAIANGLVLSSVTLEQSANSAPQAVIDPTVNQPTTAPTQQEVRLSLSLAGTHDSVRSFLDALEKNLRLFDVQILTISEADVAGQVDFQVSIETYYQ